MTTSYPPPAPPHPQWTAPPQRKSRKRFIPWALLPVAFIVGVLAGATGGNSPSTSSHSAASSPSTSSASAPATTEPAPTTEAPAEPVYNTTPVPGDFKLGITVLSKDCFGSAGCLITYRIAVTYVNALPLDPTQTYSVTYAVSGVEDGPQINTFTATGTEMTGDSEETAQTPSSKVKLTAKATDILAD